MKRARNKKSNIDNNALKKYKYESDMLGLGYDPDTFSENESDISAKPDPENEVINNSDENVNEYISENVNEDISEDTYSDKTNKKFSSAQKKRLIIFSASLVTMILVFFIAMGLGGLFNNSQDKEEITEDYMVPVDKATGKINVLVLGVDKDGLRTDTIIVACYDLDDNKIDMLSIPRDTRMYIGNRYQKINAAHAVSQSGKIKGPQGSVEAVTRLTGIPINYYVEFSFDAFKNTIDALGGVDFDVPRDMNYEDPYQNLYIHLKQGFQHLDGDKAEQLVRFRRYPQGDIARVQMQQEFIKAVADQKLNMSILGRLPDLYNVLKDDIDTNFTLIDITKYINNLKELSKDNIRMFQLPGQFSGAEYTASYWIPNMDELKTLIETEFDYEASDVTIHSADKSSVSKEGADRKATQVPASVKPSSTQKTTSTKKPSSAEKTSTSKPKSSASQSPSETAKPTETDGNTAKTTKPAEKASTKPTERPTVTTAPGTAKPTETNAPDTKTHDSEPSYKPSETTVRPARPTPNATQGSDN